MDEERLAALEQDARAASPAYQLVRWRDRTPDRLVDDRALLGALVKAAVLRDLAAADLGVQRISTTNAEWNAPMVAVNEALGFVRAGQLTTWTYRL